MKYTASLQIQTARITPGKYRIIHITLVMFLLLSLNSIVFGQSNQLETDKGIVASIAPYAADVRQAILKASQHPEILLKLQNRQEQTATEFQKMIGGFSRKKQASFYTLTRCPDLTHTLATLPAKQKKESVYKLLPNQDPDLQEAAWQLYKTDKKDLTNVDQIKVAAEQDFNKSLEGLDAPSVTAFQKLSTMPDVLTLLTNNIELTAKLADQYKANPAQLDLHLTALHDSLNVQNQYEIAAFKKQLENDPQLHPCGILEVSVSTQAFICYIATIRHKSRAIRFKLDSQLDV